MTEMGIDDLLRWLRADDRLTAQARCGHAYRLADSTLFYGDTVPEAARPSLDQITIGLEKQKADLEKRKHDLTDGFTKRSVDVKIGKTMEKVIPAIEGFPYVPGDCRPIFDPIDYLVFVGLRAGSVKAVEFVDVKTGASQLTKVQREIRDAVVDRKVNLRRAGV